MGKNPFISIAMTTYNTSQYVEAAINSVAIQSYPYWELIIIDDASTDDTIDVVKKCLKKNNIEERTKIIIHDKNYGYGRSLKDSIENGIGDLIAIVDSDDALSEPYSLDIMAKAHLKNPDVALCYSTYYTCTTKLMKRKNKIKSITPIPKGVSYLGNMKKYRVSHLKVIKRRFYNMTDGVNPTLFRSVDKDLTLKLEEVGKLLYIPKPLYIYRKRSGCLTSSFKRRPSSYKKKVRSDKINFIREARKRREKK